MVGSSTITFPPFPAESPLTIELLEELLLTLKISILHSEEITGEEFTEDDLEED